MNEKLKLIATGFGLIGMVVSGFLFVDNRSKTIAETTVEPVKASLNALDKRLTLNELRDLLRKAQEELLFWKQQKRKYPNDPDIDEELRKAQEQVDEIKERIRKLEEEEL